ncbi:homoserine dehydrogenase [Evansella cellulosilytica]|uniref:Homoserine dehydrogenase n=1 Tax=Evansella cellulosilytica (strain ATCC 21833 / DSM 2522 / FERM P-1141 / JCM 9156 / N-4) TaxID=649639 RepID=E6TQS3_EVAC2|nr:homoserine dehydrogenase [Evansella cellulosilytica]ADU31698.1 homoserine dehydrogenase [Evansella cellulosilytica DSM 2522]
MSQSFKLAIIGFGTVGEGVYRTIEKKAKKLEALLGARIEIPFVVVKNVDNRQVNGETTVTNNLDDVLNAQIHAVVEATPDSETGYPYVTALLRQGISVVSANKELLAKHGDELHTLAEQNSCQLLFEAAVAGGIPLLNTLRHTLKTNTINRLEGIVNGTSNFILTKMREESSSFASSLKEAQEKGFAEAIPDKDIDGWDPYFKTNILSRWIYGVAPEWESNSPLGIRSVNIEDIKLVEKITGRIKLVASLIKGNNKVSASVQPSIVLREHPLFNVEGVNNGIHIEGSIVGSVLLQGPGAGRYPTSSAVIEDVVNLLMNENELNKLSAYEFTEHLFDSDEELNHDEANKLWFLTGDDRLPFYISKSRLDVLLSINPINHRHGFAIKASREEIDALIAIDRLTGINVYPLLTDEKELLLNDSPVKKERTLTF